MSTPTIKETNLTQGTLISHHLCAARRELRDIFSKASVLANFDKDELAALDHEASEALSLIRSMRNKLAPVNRLPRDVLVLIPDFWHGHARENIATTLTHVCRGWREIFVSCASLWTDFHVVDAEKTRCYLKRSKSAPVSVSLERPQGLLDNDPFLEVAPRATSRLRCLSIKTSPGHLKAIAQRLVDPAPLLETLKINGNCFDPHISPALPPHLFNGDLTSLRELSLRSVRTQLPWRGMNNLTSFTLSCSTQLMVSIEQILDFLESTSRLREVWLSFVISPTPGAQNRRPVTLAHLRNLTISGSQKPSLLFDRLIIPVGAVVSTELDSITLDFDDHLPRSLDNLKNLSHFTEIRILFAEFATSVRFTGPNGQVYISSLYSTPGDAQVVFQSLIGLDTSRTERLEIVYGSFPKEFYDALRSLTNLRTLVISRCGDTHPLILGLDPVLCLNDPMACPRLEELIFYVDYPFDEEIMAAVARTRAEEGAPLKLIKVVSFAAPISEKGVTEMLKHVSDVETSVEVDGGVSYSDEVPILLRENPF